GDDKEQGAPARHPAQSGDRVGKNAHLRQWKNPLAGDLNDEAEGKRNPDDARALVIIVRRFEKKPAQGHGEERMRGIKNKRDEQQVPNERVFTCASREPPQRGKKQGERKCGGEQKRNPAPPARTEI